MSEALSNPVYQQLYQTLRRLILQGDFAEGDRFLPEREIARRYDVSRVTVGKALARLASEGILDIRKGAGAFICKTVLDYDLRHLVSFTEQAKAAGKTPQTKVLNFTKTTVAESSVKTKPVCNLDSETDLFFLERLRLADEAPVIFERRWVVAAPCSKLTKTDARGSLYSAWTDKFGLEIIGAEEVIRAINLSSKQAAMLDVLPQTAGLLVCSTGFTTGNQILWWEETLYRADIYEFFNKLGGLKTSRPAIGQFSQK